MIDNEPNWLLLLHKHRNALPKAERIALEMNIGTITTPPLQGLSAIAKVLKITKERVRQVIARGRKRLLNIEEVSKMEL